MEQFLIQGENKFLFNWESGYVLNQYLTTFTVKQINNTIDKLGDVPFSFVCSFPFHFPIPFPSPFPFPFCLIGEWLGRFPAFV